MSIDFNSALLPCCKYLLEVYSWQSFDVVLIFGMFVCSFVCMAVDHLTVRNYIEIVMTGDA